MNGQWEVHYSPVWINVSNNEIASCSRAESKLSVSQRGVTFCPSKFPEQKGNAYGQEGKRLEQNKHSFHTDLKHVIFYTVLVPLYIND